MVDNDEQACYHSDISGSTSRDTKHCRNAWRAGKKYTNKVAIAWQRGGSRDDVWFERSGVVSDGRKWFYEECAVGGEVEI